MRRIALAVAALSIGLSLTGCGDDKFTEEKFADTLVEEGFLERDIANCTAKMLWDQLEDDQLEQFENFDITTDDELSPFLRDALNTAVETCVAEAAPPPSG